MEKAWFVIQVTDQLGRIKMMMINSDD